MTESAMDIIAGVRRRRRVVVQGFLWTLLGFVVLAMSVNVIAFDVDMSMEALAPNVLLLAVVGASLWLNRQDRMEQSLGLVIGLTLGGAALPLVMDGLTPSTGIVLFVLFIPVLLAGLLMSRTALRITAGTALAIVLVPTILQATGRLPWAGPPGATAAALAGQYAIVLSIMAFFLDRLGGTLDRALRAAAAHEVGLDREVAEHRQAREELVNETQFTDSVINSLPGVFYVIDEDGRYVRWNDNFRHILGYTADEVAGLDPIETIAPSERDQLVNSVRSMFDGDATSASARATLVAKDGSRLPYLLTISRITTSNREYLAGVGLDTSELEEAQARIERLNEELRERLERIESLHEIDRAITSSLDLDLTLDLILQQVTARLGVDAASVLLYRPSMQRLRFGAATGFAGAALRTTDLRLGEGQAGQAALRREQVRIDDPDEFVDAFGRSEQILAEGVRTYLAVPLMAKGELQGVLELFHRTAFDASEDWQTFLTTLSTQVAIALDNAVLFETLQRTNTELRLAYDTTIEGWARALDLRDAVTEGHSRRVTEMTVRLAERCNVEEEKLEHVRRGALLHDIGKMAVPDSVLRKPGELTDSEWEIMMRHPTIAFELLVPIAFLRPALDIPYAHHERWDGTGYPRKLDSERIPLAARIFSVVDVYDALTSDRPYREPWSTERALAHIEEQAGWQFDPNVVQAFLHMHHQSDPDGRL